MADNIRRSFGPRVASDVDFDPRGRSCGWECGFALLVLFRWPVSIGINLWGVWTTGDRRVKRVVIRSSPFSVVCSRVCLCSPGDQNNVRSQSLRADNASRQDEMRFPLHAREGGRDGGIHHSLQRRDEEVSCEVVTASSALNMHLSTKSQLLEFPSQQSAPLATPLAAPHRLILFYFYFFCARMCAPLHCRNRVETDHNRRTAALGRQRQRQRRQFEGCILPVSRC